jgi:hypothetical protein
MPVSAYPTLALSLPPEARTVSERFGCDLHEATSTHDALKEIIPAVEDENACIAPEAVADAACAMTRLLQNEARALEVSTN